MRRTELMPNTTTYVLGLILLLAFANASEARRPGLPIPGFVELNIHISPCPELRKDFVVSAEVVALVGPLAIKQAHFILSSELLGPGVAKRKLLAKPITLAKGKSQNFAFSLRLDRPVTQGSVTLRLTCVTPRYALLEKVKHERSGENPALLRSLLSDLRRLDDLTYPMVTAGFSISPMEGRILKAKDEPYDLYLPGPRPGIMLALRKPRSPVIGKAGRALLSKSLRLVNVYKRLKSKSRARMEAQKAWDIRHALVVAALSQSGDKAALLLSDLNELGKSTSKPSEKAELANIRAVRDARRGRISQSIRWWKQAIRLIGDESHNRYYHVNLAQLLALKGEKTAARMHFGEALALNPGFSLARRGLEALQGLTQR